MTTQEVANRLVELCRKGENMTAYDELFSANAVAVEPENIPDNVTKGLDNLRAKTRNWFESVEELHSMSVSDPVVGDNFFSCSMSMDITTKEQGRSEMSEVCLYQVEDGKIVREQFFFNVPDMQG